MDNINKIANLYTDEASNIMNILNYDNKHPINYIVDDKGNFWFKGRDITDILEYKNSSNAINDHITNKAHKKTYYEIDNSDPLELKNTTNNYKNIIFINEPGLYKLIGRSNMKEADKFNNWIYEEILPSLRKYGKYEIKKSTMKSYYNDNTIYQFNGITFLYEIV